MNNLQRNHELKDLDRENKKAQAGRPAPIFNVCVYYTTLRGVNGTFSRLYLPNETNGLRQKGHAQGLDKVSHSPTLH
jgi:hypothetical protein